MEPEKQKKIIHFRNFFSRKSDRQTQNKRMVRKTRLGGNELRQSLEESTGTADSALEEPLLGHHETKLEICEEKNTEAPTSPKSLLKVRGPDYRPTELAASITNNKKMVVVAGSSESLPTPTGSPEGGTPSSTVPATPLRTSQSSPATPLRSSQSSGGVHFSLGRETSSGSMRSGSESLAESMERQCPVVMQSREAWGSLVSLLSGLYALILVILSFAFELSVILSDAVHSTQKYEPFYIYLYGCGILFMMYSYAFLLRSGGWRIPVPFYKSHTMSEINMASHVESGCPSPTISKQKVTHSAPSAGSLYLKLGCVFFGVVGMIHKGMIIISCTTLQPSGCALTTVLEASLAAMFIFGQMYFIFQNSKMVIHRYKNIGRLGTMHLVATNLCVWIRLLVLEEYKMLKEVEENKYHHEHPDFDSEEILATPKSEPKISAKLPTISESSSLLAEKIAQLFSFTPTTPLSLNNVTEALGEELHKIGERSLPLALHKGHSKHFHRDCDSATGQASIDCIMQDYTPFMMTCLIEYSIICAAVMYVLWRNIGHRPKRPNLTRKHHLKVDCSSSTRGLFLGLLFVICTIVSMIVFFVKQNLDNHFEALWVFYFTDMILYLVSTGACVAGMYKMRKLRYAAMQHVTMHQLDDILLFVALVGQLIFCVFSVIALTKLTLITGMIVLVSVVRMIQVLIQTVFILGGTRLVALTSETGASKPGRNIVTYLLMVNLALFLLNIFEAHKASVNPVMLDFYGLTAWIVIVQSTVPLTIFYRFHSSVCLVEIWKQAYKVKGDDN